VLVRADYVMRDAKDRKDGLTGDPALRGALLYLPSLGDATILGGQCLQDLRDQKKGRDLPPYTAMKPEFQDTWQFSPRIWTPDGETLPNIETPMIGIHMQ